MTLEGAWELQRKYSTNFFHRLLAGSNRKNEPFHSKWFGFINFICTERSTKMPCCAWETYEPKMMRYFVNFHILLYKESFELRFVNKCVHVRCTGAYVFTLHRDEKQTNCKRRRTKTIWNCCAMAVNEDVDVHKINQIKKRNEKTKQSRYFRLGNFPNQLIARCNCQ